LGALYCALDTEETPAAAHARAEAEQKAEQKRASTLQYGEGLVTSPLEDRDGRGRTFNSLPPESPDSPTPQPATQDIAGRRRVADFIRRAGTLLDPDPERYNNRAYREGRYRTYPRTPGEDLLNPKLLEHEQRFYEARRAGHSHSKLSLVVPSSPNLRDSQAIGSGSGSQTPAGGSQTPKPEISHHHRSSSSSGAGQFLEVPRTIHHSPPPTAIVTTPTITEVTPQQPSLGLLLENVPPRITIT
jgi:hypothetical protein